MRALSPSLSALEVEISEEIIIRLDKLSIEILPI